MWAPQPLSSTARRFILISLNVVSGEVLDQPFAIGRPVLYLLIERTHRAVNRHTGFSWGPIPSSFRTAGTPENSDPTLVANVAGAARVYGPVESQTAQSIIGGKREITGTA